MDSRLSFVKCQFCCKNFNKCQLIEMTENMVSINDEEITYVDLIFDTVCFFKVCLHSQTVFRNFPKIFQPFSSTSPRNRTFATVAIKTFSTFTSSNEI